MVEVAYNITYLDPVEVENLASRQDGWDNLMLFGGSQDKECMAWRFFQGFQESVKCLGRKHMHLINDINTVTSNLWWNPYLVDQVTDIINRVIGCGIQFVDIVTSVVIKCHTRFTLVTGFGIGRQVAAIDGLGKNAGTGGFSHTPWTTKQVRMGQLLASDGILQGTGNGILCNYGTKCVGPVFSG